jgi:AraC family transcriptional regulator
MYLSAVSDVEGRYFEFADDAGFAPIGRLFFRPAKLHLNIRGNMSRREARAVHCTLDDCRLRALATADAPWTPDQLQAALNIRAGHLQAHFLRLMRELRRPGFASSVITDAVLVLMMDDLFAYLSPAAREGRPRTAIGERAVQKIRDRVHDLQSVTPTVGELARLCGLSDRHLLRVFREHQGVSLIEFIRQARLEKGVELLSHSELPLKEVAFRLGFASHASFATAFGRETGMSPAQFRRERRRVHPAPFQA